MYDGLPWQRLEVRLKKYKSAYGMFCLSKRQGNERILTILNTKMN